MRSDGTTLPLAVAVSIAGLLVHTVVEFGPYSVWNFSTGFLPYSILQIAILLWFTARPSRAAALALFATALLQLVGGAILSVLPLPILPFEPAQTASHYGAHVVLGVAQVPLLLASWKARLQA